MLSLALIVIDGNIIVDSRNTGFRSKFLNTICFYVSVKVVLIQVL